MGGNYERGLYKQLMEVMERLNSVEKTSRKEINNLNNKISDLEKENRHLKEENKLLREDNARLKSILDNNSSNTSQPPSTDRKGAKPANAYNGREKTGRRAGGQKGHRGITLTKADVEEEIRSGRCRHQVRIIGDPAGKTYITKYKIDIDVAPVITEIRIYADGEGRYAVPAQYRSDVVYGANVKAMAVALYSEGVMSNDRIAAFLNAVSGGGLRLSEGSVYRFCSSFSRKSEGSITHLEEELLNQPVVSTDATAITVNGRQGYIRNFSGAGSVLYRAMKDKTLDAMHKIRFLELFAGILVHDHETALYHFGTGHGECNVHLIRYLRKNTEDTGNTWSGEMIKLLCEMNQARKAAIVEGASCFETSVVAGYEKEYDSLIASGRGENKRTKHRYAKKEEKALLNRMERYKWNHLLFLHDFRVPFDNNMSERDLRKAKNRQKMAGGFRKASGHEMYCNILTIVETLKRRKMAIFENIKMLFMGTPAIFQPLLETVPKLKAEL